MYLLTPLPYRNHRHTCARETSQRFQLVFEEQLHVCSLLAVSALRIAIHNKIVSRWFLGRLLHLLTSFSSHASSRGPVMMLPTIGAPFNAGKPTWTPRRTKRKTFHWGILAILVWSRRYRALKISCRVVNSIIHPLTLCFLHWYRSRMSTESSQVPAQTACASFRCHALPY